MTDRKPAVSVRAHKQRRPFAQLPPNLSQLVEDRFDEDQYDQAVELLEQLRCPGIIPPESLIQKLVALSLCSLAPGQVASTSGWTLDHQFQDISTRLLSQAKGNKNDGNAIKAASSATTRPAQAAVLKATSLLIQYSETDDNDGASPEKRCEESLLARHILASLPSRRRRLQSSPVTSPKSPRHASRDSFGSDTGDQDASFELSSIERWVRDTLQRSEDVWDLLCDRRFSNPPEPDDVSLGRVSGFWMNQSERKRYQRQLQAAGSTHQRLEDRLREIRWKRLNGYSSGDPSDLDSDDTTDDDILRGLSVPGRPVKRPIMSRSRGPTKASLAKPVKRARKGRNIALPRDDEDAQHLRVKLTEGAWRTLSVFLKLWERASTHEASKTADTTAADEDGPPLLWQFPHGESTRLRARSAAKAATRENITDNVDRALDIAFSFPSILPAYAPVMTGTEAVTGLFKTAKAIETRGEARPLSSVSQVELIHRQRIANQSYERSMAERADIAAHLLASIYELVRLGYIRPAAFIEGVSERIEALTGSEVQYIMLPLLGNQPSLVANALATYLHDTAQTHPDKIQSATRSDVLCRFGNGEEISIGAALAYAVPCEEAANLRLRNRAARDHDPDANSILDFLSLNRLELDGSINKSLPLTFPSKAESTRIPLVHKQKQKQVKRDPLPRRAGKTTPANGTSSANTADDLAEDVVEGGLASFAYLRALQMESRDRINQMKFLIARALVKMHVDDATRQDNAESGDWPSERETNPSVRRQVLQLFLSRLIKAFDRDAGEFEKCLSAMRSHGGRDNAARRLKHAFGPIGTHDSKDDPASLPSIDAMEDRCQRCFDATRVLARSTRFLRESVV